MSIGIGRLLRILFTCLTLLLLPVSACGSEEKPQTAQASVAVTQAKPNIQVESKNRIANTPSPTSTPTPVSIIAKVNSNANLRKGPGTDFDIVGGKTVGDVVTVRGCNEACDWYLLSTGEWVAAFLVSVEGIKEPLDSSDQEVLEYMSLVTSNLTLMADALEDTFSTLERFSVNPYDSSWQSDLLVNFVGILYPCRLITDATAPRKLKPIHSQLSEGCDHYTNMVDYLAKLIDTGDIKYANLAENELDLGLSLFTIVAKSLDRIATERTITKVVPVPTIAERKYTPVLVPTPTPIITPTAVPLSNL